MRGKHKKIEALLLGIIFAVSIYLIWQFFQSENSYKRYANETVSYVQAKVLNVIDQELVLTGENEEYMTGFQQVELQLKDGETVELEHYVTLTHNVIVRRGMSVIVCLDSPEGIDPYYTIYNYDRKGTEVAILTAFFVLLLIIGKIKGVRSALGLMLTLSLIVCYMIPKLYEGGSAVYAILLTIIMSSAGSCFCIGGFGKKTLCSMTSTIFGGIIAGGLYFLLMKMMKMSVGALETSEELQMISQATGMSLQGVMFAGIMIAVLGAVMDVAVSLGSALWEIVELKRGIDKKQLFAAGMNIGKDRIGTMTNTLILAFLGGALPALLIFLSYGVSYHQFLSSDFLALELVQAIAGSTAVILTVPVSSLVCAYVYCRKERLE